MDTQKFRLVVTDAKGVTIEPTDCPQCGQAHFYVVSTRNVPTFSFVNPYDEEVSAEILCNDLKHEEILLPPGGGHRVFGDLVSFHNSPSEIWCGSIKIYFQKKRDQALIEGAEVKIRHHLVEYLESMRSDEAVEHAEFLMERITESAQRTHNGKLSFNFVDQSSWEKIKEISGHVDEMLGMFFSAFDPRGRYGGNPQYASAPNSRQFDA